MLSPHSDILSPGPGGQKKDENVFFLRDSVCKIVKIMNHEEDDQRVLKVV